MSEAAGQGLFFHQVGASFGRNTVLHGVSLAVAPGETLVLFGPSGAGKTVLLRALAGLDPQSTGEIRVDGRDVSVAGPEARDLGVAFQNFALYPHMSARENIASPLRARRVAPAELDARVARVSAMLRISHVLDQLPRALSNGQKQRTALARALVGEPKVLLLDDPLRNVDAKLRYEMRMELPRLLRRSGAASIYVTQDYREAMALGDRIAVMIDGRIVQCADPEEVYDRPGTTAVARLFGDPPVNLIACRPVHANDGVRVTALGLDLFLRAGAALAGCDALLGFRPEDLVVTSQPQAGAAEAVLEAVTPLHDKSVMLLRTSGGEEILASAAGAVPDAGTAVWFRPDTERALLYDARSGLLETSTEAAL